MYIYAEFILIENLIINFLILLITNKLLRFDNMYKVRLFLAALLGSIFSIIFLYFEAYLVFQPLVKLILSCIMILIAFNPKNLSLFIKQMAGFYMVSFTFAGGILGLYYFFKNTLLKDMTYLGIYKSFLYIVLGLFLTAFLMIFLIRAIKFMVKCNTYYALIRLSLNNEIVEFNALVDTGNSLTEPISGKPVIVCEYGVLKNIFPEPLNKLYEENKMLDYDLISKVILDMDDYIKIRIIPYKSIGKDFGILLGFVPDYIEVKTNDEEKHIKKEVVVAIHNDKLDSNNYYSGLLSPETIY